MTVKVPVVQRFFRFLPFFVLVLGLTACSKSDTGSNDTGTAAATKLNWDQGNWNQSNWQ